MRASIPFSLIAMFLLSASVGADDHPNQSTVAIHSSTLSADELAQLLGIYVWKFEVSVPKDARLVNLGLQNTTKGQSPAQLGSAVACPISDDSSHDILIAIAPVGGSITDADTVRITMIAFGAEASSTASNPLRTLGIDKPKDPETVGDGVFNLVGGYSGSTIQSPLANADVVISLKIEAK